VRLPIIDMHLHAMAADAQGPPPLAFDLPTKEWPVHDPEEPWDAAFIRWLKTPRGSDPIWSPATDDEIRDETLAIMERRNIIAVLSGDADRVQAWQKRAPGRIIPALWFQVGGSPDGGDEVTPEDVRNLHRAGRLAVFGEVLNQYGGIEPTDPRFEPYLAVCEELDVPVGIHVGPGPPGAAYFEGWGYRMHSPLLLEEPLMRHPRLRLYLMHAGWPMLDDTLALLYAHPRVYVDVAIIDYLLPSTEFHRYLEGIVRAGFGNRVMFGSDQMVWPGVIEPAIAAIESASFLSDEQKRAILYENAARFLRLEQSEIDRHHHL
jgi:uncharacterized protein